MNNGYGYTDNSSPHITVGSNSVHENAMPCVEGVSDVVPPQTSVLHLEGEEGEEATVPGISALKRSLSVAYDDDEPSYNSVSPALRSSIGFERSSLHSYSPVQFAMNKLTEQVVETTGIRAPCPTQDGNSPFFPDSSLTRSSPLMNTIKDELTGLSYDVTNNNSCGFSLDGHDGVHCFSITVDSDSTHVNYSIKEYCPRELDYVRAVSSETLNGVLEPSDPLIVNVISIWLGGSIVPPVCSLKHSPSRQCIDSATAAGDPVDLDPVDLKEKETETQMGPPKLTRGGTIVHLDLGQSSRNVSFALDSSDSSKESSLTPCFELHTPQSMVAMFEEQRKIAERVSEENRRIRNSGKSHVAVFYPVNHTEDEKGLIFAAKCPKCYNVDVKFMLDSKDKQLSSFVVIETYAGSGVDLECLCCRHTFKFCHGNYSFLPYPKQNCVSISYEWAKVELLGGVDISKYPVEV